MAGTDIKLISKAADGFEFAAYRAQPTGARRGGLVLIQEVFGVDQTMRTLSDDFAAAGYEVIAPSLFDRTEPNFHAEPTEQGFPKAMAAANAVDWTQAMGDIQACIDALEGPVFVAGFCWGGTATWLAACRCTGLTAGSSFYGGRTSNFLGEAPKVPVIFHYGADDGHIPLEGNVDKVRDAVRPPSAVYVYAGAGHAFMAARAYNEAAASLAKARTLAFFADPSKAPT